MPGLLELLRAVYHHSNYVSSELLRGVLSLLVAVAVGHSALMIFAAPASYRGVETATMFTVNLYALIMCMLFANMLSEVDEGEAALYLAHSLSRRAYLASWTVAAILLPTLGYVLSIALPLAVIAPDLLAEPRTLMVLRLSVLQLLTQSSVVVAVATLSRSRGATVVAAVVVTWGFFVLLAIAAATGLGALLLLAEVLSPAVAAAIPLPIPVPLYVVEGISGLVALALYALSFTLFVERLEV